MNLAGKGIQALGLIILSGAACMAGQTDRSLRMSAANNRFAAEIYREASRKDRNVFLSPYSISIALAMVYVGARGKTAEELYQTLHFDEFHTPTAGVPEHFRMLSDSIEAIRRKGQIELAIANSLWPDQTFPIKDAFRKLLTTAFEAAVTPVDFMSAPRQARDQINRWAGERTRDKIVNLVPDGVLNADTRLVLANAIYFKGKWGKAFDRRLTSKQDFHTGAGRKVKADLMMIQDDFFYTEDENVQLLRLDYQGGNMAMVIVLPKGQDGLQVIEGKLTGELLTSWISSAVRREVKVFLPRFQVTSEFDLATLLPRMGIRDAFDPGKADLSGISDGPEKLFLGAVLHKAFVEVGEEGTEAAAATGITMGITSMPAKPIVFRADHPFLFLIYDNQTGSILFMGHVLEPTG